MSEPSLAPVRPTQEKAVSPPAGRRNGRHEVLQAIGVYVGAWAVVVVLWGLFATQVDNPLLIPSPDSVLTSLIHLLRSGILEQDMAISLGRMALGYGLALGVGLLFGISMGLIPLVHDLLEPVVEVFRPISGIAWIPLALLMFGIGAVLPIFIVFYGSVFPIIINTIAGIVTVDPSLKRAARTMGIPPNVMIRHVILPGALPMIFTGARIAIGLAWMSIVAGELLGSSSGLGYAIGWYQELLKTSDMVAVIVVIGALGYTSDLLVRLVQKLMTPWQREGGAM